MADSQARQLEAAIPNCRFEAATFEETPPSACGTLLPALILVDASQQIGREFIMNLRAEACGRFIPVAALTRAELPLGADITLDPGSDPGSWVEALQALLP